MNDPFYIYPTETERRLDALLNTPVQGPKEWACHHRPDVGEIPETIVEGMGNSMQLQGYKGTLRNPQPFFPECPTCPQLRGTGPIYSCMGHGWFLQRREP